MASRKGQRDITQEHKMNFQEKANKGLTPVPLERMTGLVSVEAQGGSEEAGS